MKRTKLILLAIAPVLAGCAGPGGLTLAEQLDFSNALFVHVRDNQNTTLVANLPGPSATYLGSMAITVNTDGIRDDPDVDDNIDEVVLPGGDFRALGDATLSVDFASFTVDGGIVIVGAEEGHTMSGSITLLTMPLVGATFAGSYTSDIVMDGAPLIMTSEIIDKGEIKGPFGEFFIAGILGVIDNGALPDGEIYGGILGQIVP